MYSFKVGITALSYWFRVLGFGFKGYVGLYGLRVWRDEELVVFAEGVWD